MRKVAVRVAAAMVGLILIAACGHSDNTDPRKGRVTTYESNCWSGSCSYDWKVCIGPDMLFHVAGHDHVIKGSPECVR